MLHLQHIYVSYSVFHLCAETVNSAQAAMLYEFAKYSKAVQRRCFHISERVNAGKRIKNLKGGNLNIIKSFFKWWCTKTFYVYVITTSTVEICYLWQNN